MTGLHREMQTISIFYSNTVMMMIDICFPIGPTNVGQVELVTIQGSV